MWKIFRKFATLVIFIQVVYALLCEASKCEKLASLAALEDHNTIVHTSLKLLEGTWISEGCETRPGPEFVLRSYTFEEEGRFSVIQHHYWDDSCSSPKLTIISYGKVLLRNSLIQAGAASATIRVTNISVIPQDNNAAKELDRVVTTECPGQYWKSWRRYEEHTVYDNRFDDNKRKTYNLWVSATYDLNNHHPVNSNSGNTVHYSDISCLGSLKWAFNELKLIKIQMRPLLEHLKKKPREMKLEMLLGDIHSNPKMRQFYHPTCFQVPLVKQVLKEETIFVNRHSYLAKNTMTPLNVFTTNNNNGKTPPHLLEKPHLPPYIWGEWTSTRCETRPMGLYLTRRFSFYSEDETWIGEHKFYSDPFCRIPKFIVTAAGHFKLTGPSDTMKGASNIDFHIERASLTVLDEKMIYDMRLPGLCGQEEWQVDVPKELSSTNGCVQLGIILPSVLYDIVKLEMDYRGSCLLYLGQVDTDNLHSISTERPTAFQTALVKCGEVASYSQSLRNILRDTVYYSGGERTLRFTCGSSSLLSLLTIFVLLICCLR